MQSSGPAARPGPKFKPVRAFCRARTKSAGLMPGSGQAITMYYALAAGLREALERCWPGSMLGSAGFVRCQSGLGLGFWITFCTSNPDVRRAVRTEPICPEVRRGTIWTPSSKVGKKGMCKKGHEQKGHQVTSSTSGGLHNEKPI